MRFDRSDLDGARDSNGSRDPSRDANTQQRVALVEEDVLCNISQSFISLVLGVQRSCKDESRGQETQNGSLTDHIVWIN
jgi:hypothetical protein